MKDSKFTFRPSLKHNVFSRIWRSIHSALWGITLPSDADEFGMAVEKIVITEALKRKEHVLFLMPEEFLHDEVTGLGYVVCDAMYCTMKCCSSE